MAESTPLIIHTQRTASALVLAPQGEIATHEAPTMQQAVKEAFESRPAKVVIDLTSVSYMATSGLATLVQAAQQSNKTKIPLVLCGLQERVKAVIDISRLTSFFKIVGTQAEAGV
jgi:anti-sigma B factor antagonist